MQSRLQAEVRGEPAMEMPAELVAVAGDSEVQGIFAQQQGAHPDDNGPFRTYRDTAIPLLLMIVIVTHRHLAR